MPISLYTTKDIQDIRKELIAKQGGIDPITKEKFKEVIAVDHCHTYQHIRQALNRNTNAFEGLVANAHRRCLSWLTKKPLPELLRNLADYLEVDYKGNPYHPNWRKHCITQFNKLQEKQKDMVLVSLGVSKGSNSKERKEIFKEVTKDRALGYEAIISKINEVNK